MHRFDAGRLCIGLDQDRRRFGSVIVSPLGRRHMGSRLQLTLAAAKTGVQIGKQRKHLLQDCTHGCNVEKQVHLVHISALIFLSPT
jgi:hypothetical protein